MTTPSRPASQPPSILTAPPLVASKKNGVTTVAERGISAAESASSAQPLAGTQEIPPYDFETKLDEANELLKYWDHEAGELFDQVLKQTAYPQVSSHWHFALRCQIGIAILFQRYGRNITDMLYWTEEAAKILEKRTAGVLYWTQQALQVLGMKLAERSSWNTSEIETINTYKLVRKYLFQIQALVPAAETSFHLDINEKLADCAKHIPLLIDFNDLINETYREDREKAKKLLLKALVLIEGKTEDIYLIPRAKCLLKLAHASCFERMYYVYLAKDEIVKIDEKRELLCMEGREALLKLLVELWSQLGTFYRQGGLGRASIDDFNSKRDAYQLELWEIQKTQPAPVPYSSEAVQSPPPSISSRSPSEELAPKLRNFPPAAATQEPAGPVQPRTVTKCFENEDVRLQRLFVFFAVATIAISVAVLYPRSIMKVD